MIKLLTVATLLLPAQYGGFERWKTRDAQERNQAQTDHMQLEQQRLDQKQRELERRLQDLERKLDRRF